MKILLAQINPTIGAVNANCEKIIKAIQLAKKQNCDLVIFPEMSLCGYPPQDLLYLSQLIEQNETCLHKIVNETSGISVILGLPRVNDSHKGKPLYNSAAIIENGQLIGYQDKSLLPTYDVFDERRYFEPSKETKTWNVLGKKIAVTICEDIWQNSEDPSLYQGSDPILQLAADKPDLLVNISASPFSYDKLKKRLKIAGNASKTLQCPIVYCNQVGGNDSLIFDGYSFFIVESEKVCNIAKGFQEDFLVIDTKETASTATLDLNCSKEIYQALVLGVKDYFFKSGFKKACIGLSGGIDSALVASVAVDALGSDNVLAVAMPSRYSSTHSLIDAKQLAQNLNIHLKEISIEEPFKCYLDLLAPHFAGYQQDTTEENLQARIRGVLLMALSNKFGSIVLSTGNKSEMAMGYCTLYGDMCGGLAVLGDVTKTQVYQIAKWLNKDKVVIPENILIKAPSAELKLNQKDQDTLPDYEIVDQVIQAYVENHLKAEDISKKFNYPLEVVQSLIKRIHQNEYKRRQAAPVIKVSEKALTAGRFFPIVERLID